MPILVNQGKLTKACTQKAFNVGFNAGFNVEPNEYVPSFYKKQEVA